VYISIRDGGVRVRLRRQRYGGLFVCCTAAGGKKIGVEEEGYNTHNARGVIRSGHHE